MKILKLLFLFVGLLTWAALGQDFVSDPKYGEADSYLLQSRYIQAREIAEAMLRSNPNSFEGQSILGRVHLHGEGNPGKADYYLRKARQAIVKRYPNPNYAESPWKCYADTLWSLNAAAMDLEQYQQAIDWADEYNKSFPPGDESLYGWPLMKMGKMKQARTKMALAKEKAKENQDIFNSILNTLGAIEYEAGNFEESLRVYREILARLEKGLGEKEAVFYANTAEAARDLLDFPAAEKYLLDATKHLSSNSYSDPWLDLAALYLDQGRQLEALQAVKRHATHLASCEASIQNQKRAQAQRILGMTLMACGYDLEACQILAQVAEHGDRNSGTSTKRSLVRSRNQFFYLEALHQKLERLREERSFSQGKLWWNTYSQEYLVTLELEAVRLECAALALDNDGPQAMLVPYGPRGFNCPWLIPGLCRVFGSGVVSVEASRLLKNVPAKSKPFLKAIIAEANQNSSAMEEALKELPPSQVLLRARLHALLGQAKKSPVSYLQALESDPPVLRRLALSLPVTIETSDRSLKSMVLSSPRFHKGKGFMLQIQGTSESGFSGQLLGPDGSVLHRLSAAKGADGAETRRKFCQELHQDVFAPRINLTQSDINSLDGSNLAASKFRDQLTDLVGTSPKQF